MNHPKTFSLHEASLFYLFTLGGSLFTFGKCGALCFITASLMGAVTLLIAFFLKNHRSKPLLVLLAAFSFSNGVYTFCKFVYFIREKQLFHTPLFLIGAVFAAVVIFLFLSPQKAVLKFSLVAAVFCVLLFGVLFFTTVKNAEIKDIRLAFDFDFKETLKVYFSLFLPAVIPVFFTKSNIASAEAGINAVSVTLLAFIILTYCTFGSINSRLDSPILSLVDTANVGRVFTRLDALLLAVIYLSCLTRCAVSFKSVRDIFATFNAKKSGCQLTKN